METGTQPQTAYDKLETWLPAYETHSNRLLTVVDRMEKVFGQWVSAMKFPVDSFEHQIVINKLCEEMKYLAEDSKETLDNMGSDFNSLKVIFESVGKEFLSIRVAKKEENVP